MKRDVKIVVIVAAVLLALGIWYIASGGKKDAKTGEQASTAGQTANKGPGSNAQHLPGGKNDNPRMSYTPPRQTPPYQSPPGTVSPPKPAAGQSGITPSGNRDTMSPPRPVPPSTVTPSHPGSIGGTASTPPGLQPPAGSPSGSSAVSPAPTGPGTADIQLPGTPAPQPTKSSATSQPATREPSPVTDQSPPPSGVSSSSSLRPGAADMGLRAPLPSVAVPGKTSSTIQPLTPGALDAETPSALVAKTTHIVQPGDSFSSIAAKYLKSAKHADLVAKANPGIDPRRLKIGAKVTIPPIPAESTAKSLTDSGSKQDAETKTREPAASATDKTDSIKKATEAAPIPPERAYKVKASDSWHGLAERFLGKGDRWLELYELNKERLPQNGRFILPVGKTIELPKEVPLEVIKAGGKAKEAAAPKSSKSTTKPSASR